MKKRYLSIVLLFLCTPIISLPLSAQVPSNSNELVDFSVTKSGKELIISWTSFSENSQRYFLLERAGDDRVFIPLKKLELSAGNKEPKEYEFIDSHPLSGMNIYRLKQINQNGKLRISPSIEMSIESSSELDFYVYKKEEALYLEIDNPNRFALQLELLDLNGKVIYLEEIDPTNPIESMKIGTEQLSAGLYMIRLKCIKGKTISRKFRI